MNLTVDQIFNGANLFVLPFWILMIFLPNWKVTRKVMKSYIPFALLAIVYLYLFINSINPESAAALSNPQLDDIAKVFADKTVATAGWVHFLVMDLFVGRYIYWQGQETGIWTIHSLAFCLFAGPIGLLSHILTTWINRLFVSKIKKEIDSVTDSSTVEPS
ncbi:MAG: ABA4-like family protein [Microcoleaceae cyanobacterium]